MEEKMINETMISEPMKGKKSQTGVAFFSLVKRNVKMFFKDKGTFFTSLATPIILLVLYATFLYKVYRDSFLTAFGEFPVDATQLDGLVGGLLLSSLLAVSTVTVSFCANLFMVQDKVTGARGDFNVSPTPVRAISASYYLATAINGLLISYCATLVGFVYLAFNGWYLSVVDVLALFGDVLLLVAFGTALSSFICYPLSSQGQLSAVGTIVSSCYGFICGAYMPISSFGTGLRNVLAFFPGTYGTSLLRRHALRGVIEEMGNSGVPEAILKGVKDTADYHLYFCGAQIETWKYYLAFGVALVLLVAGYLALAYFLSKNKSKKREKSVKIK